MVRPYGIGSLDPVPHITVSTDGTPPFAAEKLLQQGYQPIADGPVISGRVGLYRADRAMVTVRPD